MSSSGTAPQPSRRVPPADPARRRAPAHKAHVCLHSNRNTGAPVRSPPLSTGQRGDLLFPFRILLSLGLCLCGVRGPGPAWKRLNVRLHAGSGLDTEAHAALPGSSLPGQRRREGSITVRFRGKEKATRSAAPSHAQAGGRTDIQAHGARCPRPLSRHPLSTPAGPSFLSPGDSGNLWRSGAGRWAGSPSRRPHSPSQTPACTLAAGTHLPHLLPASRTSSLNWASALGARFSAPTSPVLTRHTGSLDLSVRVSPLKERSFPALSPEGACPRLSAPASRLRPASSAHSLAQLNFATISASGSPG